MQRVKVGVIGLAAIILLIGLASVIIGSATRERPVSVIGAPQPEVVANMALGNNQMPVAEPLAELGVAPTSNAQAPAGVQ